MSEELVLAKSTIEKFPRFIKEVSLLSNNQNMIVEIFADSLCWVVSLLKNHTLMQYLLVDITAVDFPNIKQRFVIVYQFLSLIFNHRITIKIKCESLDNVSSITNIYKSAGWLEREVWDLFGIFFSGHSDLRRILTDYGFQGFPLRKDFPLSGFLELIYSNETKKVQYVSLELSQEYRFFDFINSW
jgi:NADH/F420H2 dehydrogenase subunit C